MQEKIEYRQLKEDDFDLISCLHKREFHNDIPSNFWGWKYYDNSAGKHCIYVLFDSVKNRIGGMIGGIPVMVKYQGREVLTGQSCDIVIQPEYREGRSYFKLNNLSIRESKRRGCSFVFGFSNELTYQLSMRILGFEEVGPVMRLIKIVNATPYLKRKIKIKFLCEILGTMLTGFVYIYFRYNNARHKKMINTKGLSIEAIEKFDRRFDDLWDEVSKEYEILLVRDTKYLNWRFVEKPENNYKIFALITKDKVCGYIVVEISVEEIKTGRILDLFVKSRNKEYFSLLIMKAEEYFLENKVDIIVCWMMNHHVFYKLLLRLGFLPQKTKHSLIVKPFQKSNGTYITKKSNWYITMSDSDFF